MSPAADQSSPSARKAHHKNSAGLKINHLSAFTNLLSLFRISYQTMPTKTKQRSNVGLTNKSATHASSRDCVCKVCTCGRHRCTTTNYSTLTSSVANAKLESSTEQHDQYSWPSGQRLKSVCHGI
jgi:hypothetical protein